MLLALLFIALSVRMLRLRSRLGIAIGDSSAFWGSGAAGGERRGRQDGGRVQRETRR